LGPVGTPYRLYLVTLERKRDIVPVLYHVAGEWYGKVVAQPFLADLPCEACLVFILQRGIIHLFQVAAGIQDLE